MSWASRLTGRFTRIIYLKSVRGVAVVAVPAATLLLTTVYCPTRTVQAYQLTSEDQVKHSVYTDHKLTKRLFEQRVHVKMKSLQRAAILGVCINRVRRRHLHESDGLHRLPHERFSERLAEKTRNLLH